MMLELKQKIAADCVKYLNNIISDSIILGIGTGSSVNEFIKQLSSIKHKITAAVTTSQSSEKLLREVGIKIYTVEQASKLELYIDGADEINTNGEMIKGGGGALTKEKIVASMAQKFICLADNSKQVQKLGKFPLPVEVIPISSSLIMAYFTQLDAKVFIRKKDNGEIYISENSAYIIDVHNLNIKNPLYMEQSINQIAGVITNGIFAQNKANMLISNDDKHQIKHFTY